MFVDLEAARAQEDERRAALRDSLPVEFQDYLERVELEYSAIVGESRDRRDRAIAAAEKALKPLRAQREKLEAELNAAKAYLQAIPPEAEPGHVGEQFVITSHWPQRIQSVRDKEHEHERAIAAAGNDFVREVEPLRHEAIVEVQEACKVLRQLTPNPFRL